MSTSNDEHESWEKEMARSTQGQVNESTGRIERKQVKRVREVAWPVTRVDTRAKRFIRNLVG